MLASHLIAASAAIAIVMGVGHIGLTWTTPAFEPRDPDLLARMKTTQLRLTKYMTMWRSLLGFHVSHSMGPIIFGIAWGYLALFEPNVLFGSPFLLWAGLAIFAAYLALAVRYWFYLPISGLVPAILCYGAGMYLAIQG